MENFIEINLLPIEERKVKKDYSYFLDFRAVIPTLILISFTIAYSVGTAYYSKIKVKKTEQLNEFRKKVAQKAYVNGKIKKLEKLLGDTDAKHKAMNSINVNKQLWLDILEGFSVSIPDNSWIESISQSTDPKLITVIGNTHIFSEVGSFMNHLEGRDVFVEIKLNGIDLRTSGDANFFHFEFLVEINPGNFKLQDITNKNESEVASTGENQ